MESSEEIFKTRDPNAEVEKKALLRASYKALRRMSLKYIVKRTQLRGKKESMLEHLFRMKVQTLRCLNSSLISRRQIPKGN